MRINTINIIIFFKYNINIIYIRFENKYTE